MYILGISAFYHDSAAVLIRDGEVVAAYEEERFTRVKHDNSFPENAIKECLKTGNINPNDISCVAYYEKPLLKFERILENFIATYPHSFNTFVRTMPDWLGDKIKIEKNIRKTLNFKGEIFYIPHHLSHASSAYLGSGFKNAAILTIDGIGEYQTTGLWIGDGNKIKALKQIDFPHSLGLLYSTFTVFLSYKVNEDEYKVMGLAAYGAPIYKDLVYKLIDVKDDGSFKLNMDYFSYHKGFKMWSHKFEKLFGKPRLPSDPISKRHKDIAASIQDVTEEIIFKMLNHLYELSRTPNLCMGGGVALNALANGKIHANTPFKKVFVQGAAGDSGGALGAALYAANNVRKRSRTNLENLLLGNIYRDSEIEAELKKYKLKYKKYSTNDLIKITAKLLANRKIVGWFQDRMEFGPRALGGRSILAAPFPYSMKEKVNIVKRREQFRPFAGSVLENTANKYFEIPKTQKSFPFMNFCFVVREKMRMKIPAITHIDNTCRIQTVNRENGLYYQLIKEFNRLTGVPIVLDTSFNIKGEPLVETPGQAIEDFIKTKMDYLAIGSFIVYKN